MDNDLRNKLADNAGTETLQTMMPDRIHPEGNTTVRQHIEPSRFSGRLSPEEIEHLASCPWCRDAFAGFIEKQELVRAPASLKASVLERSQGLDVQIIAGSNHLSKKLQMFYYSLKVGAAVLCSLALLTIAPNLASNPAARAVQPVQKNQEAGQWGYYEKVDHFTKQLNRLVNLNMEVMQHDKEKR